VRIVAAGELIGDSTTRAYAEAEAWLSR